MIRLTGTLHCPPDRAPAVRDALPSHVALSRAERGCLSFDIEERAPGVFAVSETFTDRAAYQVHQTRTRASAWWRITGHMRRDFTLDGE